MHQNTWTNYNNSTLYMSKTWERNVLEFNGAYFIAASSLCKEN